ncbi:MAG: hypothetical protein QW818_02475 [Candidatus Aenigmatarchaeota archaeon]
MLPHGKNDREYRAYREDPLLVDHTRKAVIALIEDTQLPLPVTISDGSANIISPFGEISSVPSSVETTIVSYVVPPGRSAYLQRAEFGGTNIATYMVKRGASVIAKHITWWTSFEGFCVWQDASKNGLKLNPGESITVTVFHTRGMPSDHHARFVLVEV